MAQRLTDDCVSQWVKFGNKSVWGGLKLTYEALNQIVPNQYTHSQTIRSQTRACIAKSFVNKREQRMTVGNWNRLPFRDFPHPLVLKKHDILEAISVFGFRQTSA